MTYSIDKATALKLTDLQHRLYSEKKSTLILFESAGGSMISCLINEFMSHLEPRGVEYHHFDPINTGANFFNYTYGIPAKGRLGIFDRAWYSDLLENYSETEKGKRTSLSTVVRFEKYLADNGVLLVKVYLDLDTADLEKVKKSYPKAVSKDCGFLGDDEGSIKDYSLDKKTISNILDDTDFTYARWDKVKVGDFQSTVDEMIQIIISRLQRKLNEPYFPQEYEIQRIYPNPRKKVDLSQKIDKADYQKKLEKLQEELAVLQCKLAKSNRALILAFEGWDAAGKGGNIKRITNALNPRGYKAVPVPAPTAEELSHTHLWRFIKNVPEAGHITIFDRTWYGRMMVEPIEKIIGQVDYSRSGDELNNFERILANSGGIIMKFWIEISNEEQLKRFKGRQEDPMRQWKITDEDWRNREKWGIYEEYVDSMIEQTNTEYAPWYVIAGEDKKFARIQTLQLIVDRLKKELN